MRHKNADRKHEIAPYTPDVAEAPSGEEWLTLARYISTITPEPNETTEEESFYDGDGTPEETVISVAKSYAPEGHYDSEDEAQALIADLEFEIGDGRKIWHRVTSADGKKQTTGVATVSQIIAGGGDAQSYETFSCTIRYDERPEVEEVADTPEG